MDSTVEKFRIRDGLSAESICESKAAWVELPEGCKEWIDVLKMAGSERQEPGFLAAIQQPAIAYGVLSEIEQRVAAFLQWEMANCSTRLEYQSVASW